MPAGQPTIMLVVRGLKSKLSREEMDRRYKERMPRFRDIPGLIQKYYSYDEATKEWAGIYLWDTEESLSAYLESDLRKSIPSAYELEAPPQIKQEPGSSGRSKARHRIVALVSAWTFSSQASSPNDRPAVCSPYWSKGKTVAARLPFCVDCLKSMETGWCCGAVNMKLRSPVTK